METYIKVNKNEIGDIIIDTPLNGRLVISEKDNSFFVYTDLQENTTFDFMHVLNEETDELETKKYKELLDEMGRESRKRAEGMSWNNMAREYLDSYEDIYSLEK